MHLQDYLIMNEEKKKLKVMVKISVVNLLQLNYVQVEN